MRERSRPPFVSFALVCVYIDHSFETQPGYRSGQVIGSRVRWVDPGQPKKKHLYIYKKVLSFFFFAKVELLCFDSSK